jgi:hypothetical protein
MRVPAAKSFGDLLAAVQHNDERHRASAVAARNVEPISACAGSLVVGAAEKFPGFRSMSGFANRCRAPEPLQQIPHTAFGGKRGRGNTDRALQYDCSLAGTPCGHETGRLKYCRL